MNRRIAAWMKGAALLGGWLAVWAQAAPGIEHVERLPHYATGANRDDAMDLRVKVLGGEVRILRRWDGGQWQWNRRWADLERVGGTQDPGQIADAYCGGAPDAIKRNGYAYVRQTEYCQAGDDVRYYNTPRRIITALNNGRDGYVWSDRRGNRIAYNAQGQMLSYSDANSVTVSLQRDAEGYIETLKDHHGTTVLTLQWEGTGAARRLAGLSDYSGRTVSYHYTGDLLTSVTDVLGETWQYHYSGGRLAGYTNPEAERTTLEISADGVLRRRVNADGVGISVDIRYDAENEQYYQAVTDGEGTVIERWYNSFGQLIRRDRNGATEYTASVVLSNNAGSTRAITDYYRARAGAGQDRGPAPFVKQRQETDARGNTTRYQYNPVGDVTQVTRADGSMRETTYNDRSQPLTEQERNAAGDVVRRTRYSYDEHGNLEELIEAEGFAEQRRTTLTYDGYGQLKSRTVHDTVSGQTPVWQYDYDSYGNRIEITDPRGEVIQFRDFDALGNAWTEQDRRNKIRTREYDAAGNLKLERSPLAQTSLYEYDGAGRLQRLTRPDGTHLRLSHTAAGQPATLTDDADQVTVLQYNRRSQLLQIADPLQHSRSWVYDSDGRLKQIRDGEQNVTTLNYHQGLPSRIDYPTYLEQLDYDRRNQVRSSRLLVSHQQIDILRQFGYTLAGELNEQVDGRQHRYQYDYDALGRIRAVHDPALGTTRFHYDARDNLLQVEDPEGRSTYFSYTLRDELATETQQENLGSSRQRHYRYDANGNLEESGTPRGDISRYHYDDDNRLRRTEHFAPGALAAENPVPESSVDYHYNTLGQYTGYSRADLSETRSYDALGRLDTVSVDYGSFSKAFHYTYYHNGLKQAYQNPEGQIYTYHYNHNNQITSVVIPGAGSIGFGDFLWQQPRVQTLPGGSVIQREYDGLQRLTRRTLQDPAANPRGSGVYHYDPAHNIERIETHFGAQQYDYDALDRLTDWRRLLQREDPASGDISLEETAGDHYTYDGVGNRLSSEHTADPWRYNTHNQLEGYNGVSYSYDDNGHTLQKTDASGRWDYTYDSRERLTAVHRDDTLVAQYQYDPYGRRISKTVGGVTTYFFYNDQGLAAEYRADGGLIREYHFKPGSPWSTEPLFLRSGDDNQLYFYHTDHLGTPQQLISTTGALVWEAQYDAFGTTQLVHQTIENPLRFPGQYYDQETGTHYNYFRDYAPGVGRYLQGDPIGLNGGVNTYTYVLNNSIRYLDPVGLDYPTADAAVAMARHQTRSYATYERTPQASLIYYKDPSWLGRIRGESRYYVFSPPSTETYEECGVFTNKGGFAREHAGAIKNGVSMVVGFPSTMNYSIDYMERQAQRITNETGLPTHYTGSKGFGVVYPGD